MTEAVISLNLQLRDPQDIRIFFRGLKLLRSFSVFILWLKAFVEY